MPEFPGKIRRTLSLTRGITDARGGGLFRRLSSRGGRPPTKDFNLSGDEPQRRVSISGPHPLPVETANNYFPSQELPRPGLFHRRPTNLSQRAKLSKKKAQTQGDDGVGAFVNLEGGLAVTLNLEVHTGDPAGITTPYTLLVPALWYEGGYEPNATRVVKGWKKWLGQRKKKKAADESLDRLEDDDHPHDDRLHDDITTDLHDTQQDYAEYRSSDEDDAHPDQMHHQSQANQDSHHHEYDSRPSSDPARPANYEGLSESDLDDEDISDEEVEPRPKRKDKKWFGLI